LLDDVPAHFHVLQEVSVLKVAGAERTAEIKHVQVVVVCGGRPQEAGEEGPGELNRLEKNRIALVDGFAAPHP